MQHKQENQVSSPSEEEGEVSPSLPKRPKQNEDFPFNLFLMKSSIVKLFCIHIHSS